MISKRKHTTIELPLSIGSQELKNNLHQIISIHSSQYQLHLKINQDQCFKSFLSNTKTSQPFICTYNIIDQQKIQITNPTINNLMDFSQQQNIQDQDFPIYSQQSKNNPFQFSYRLFLQSTPKNNHFSIHIQQENIQFEIIKITSNVKFVKNTILIDLLNSQNYQQKGLLTMDQSNRFLFLQQNITFPVVGLWLKTSKQLNTLEVYDHLSQFIKQKFSKKCIFKSNSAQETYFYFFKVDSEGKKIESFLVSYTQENHFKKSYKISSNAKKIDIKCKSSQEMDKKGLTLEINKTIKSVSELSKQSSKKSSSIKSQENGMDFTLRQSKNNEISTLESLINYSYLSPIKQLQHQKKTQSLFSQDFQNSPQFSTLCKKDDFETECVELRTKVKEQEIEIQKLRQIISTMQSQIKLYRNSRMSTNCQSSKKDSKFSSQVNSPNSNPFTLSQGQSSNGLSPKDVRRLRQSDLRSNSVAKSDWPKNSNTQQSNKSKKSSHSNSEEIESLQSDSSQSDAINLQKFQNSSRKINTFNPLPQINEEDTRDPWEYMEIIEG